MPKIGNILFAKKQHAIIISIVVIHFKFCATIYSKNRSTIMQQLHILI